ncbi:MAG: tetratricopeptide repeat protein, partial [Cyanobacteria bacterium J06621_8]
QEVKREQAIPIAKKAIEIYRQQLGSRNPYIAAKLINFGLLYDNLIRYSEAESIYLEALEINRETLGSRHPKVALNLNSLAILYESQGRYSEAELLYIEALEIDREQLEPFHSAIATALSNLAGLYYHQGRYDEMKPLLEESILIREELNDELGLSYSFGWLAFMYKAQHNYDEAVKLTKKTLNIVRKHRGERHNAYAIDLNNLGLLYNAQGRYSEAEPLFKQALDIYREVLELRERDTNFATSLNSLGKSYHYQRKYIEAESSYNQALEIFREQLGDKHPDTALSFNNLAELHLTQENSQQAIEFLTQGIQIEEYNISENLIPGSEKQKRDYIAKVSASTDLAISLNLHSVSNNSKATNLALTTILQRKGRILDILTNSLKILRRQTHNPETQKLLTDYYNLNNQYSNLVFQKPEDIESFDIHRQQLIELENQTKQLEDQLSRRSAEFRELTEPVTLEKIQQLIPQDSALVELVRYKPFNPQESANKRWGEPRYAAYILHSEGNPQAIDLGEAEPIDKAVDQFRKTLCTTTEPTKSSIENCIKNLPIEQVKSSAQKRPLA